MVAFMNFKHSACVGLMVRSSKSISNEWNKSCPDCQQVFSKRDVMLRHRRNKHGRTSQAYPPPPPHAPPPLPQHIRVYLPPPSPQCIGKLKVLSTITQPVLEPTTWDMSTFSFMGPRIMRCSFSTSIYHDDSSGEPFWSSGALFWSASSSRSASSSSTTTTTRNK